MVDRYGSIEDLESAAIDRPVDEILRVLSDRYARTTIAYLYDRPDTTLDQLAAIAAAQQAVTDDTIATESTYERACIRLYHVTLPRLDAHDFLEFDPETRTVTATDIPEPVYAFLGVETDP